MTFSRNSGAAIVLGSMALFTLSSLTAAADISGSIPTTELALANLSTNNRLTESELKGPREALEEALLTIKPGVTTRAQVESYLTERDGGPQGISSTRYFAHGTIVEVPFDQTGGTWTSSNRVSGPVTLLLGQRHDF